MLAAAARAPTCPGGAVLLQRRLAGSLALGEFDLGHCNEDFGAGLQIRRLEHGLLLGRGIRRHHGERIHQRLVGRFLDAVPIGLEIIGLEESRKRAQDRFAVDLLFALRAVKSSTKDR